MARQSLKKSLSNVTQSSREMASYPIVCSFLPAATNILVALGLEHLVHAVTFECPMDRPRIIHSSLHEKDLSADEINTLIAQHKQESTTVNTIDEELLLKIKPDIIFTQAICNVCQIGEDDVNKALKKYPLQTQVYSLNPKSLEDVFETIHTVAKACGYPEKGDMLISSLKEINRGIEEKLSQHHRALKKCSFFEWMEPTFNCGHWIPDQLKIAGGYDELANPNGYSYPVAIKEKKNYNPEIIIFSACGMSLHQSLEEVEKVLSDPFWKSLSAYQNGKIWIVDGNLFTQPGPELVNGVLLLAALFNPDLFEFSPELDGKYVQFREPAK